MNKRPDRSLEHFEALESVRSQADAANDSNLSAAWEAVEKDPQLASRLARIQDWDARISETLADVSVPHDLAERIHRCLEESQPSIDVARVRKGRRRVLWSVAAGVGVAVLLIALAQLGSGNPPLSADALQILALERFEAERAEPPLSGKLAADVPSPADLPFSNELISVRGRRWRELPDFAGKRAVAYDLPLMQGRRATLYVVRRAATGLPAAPPAAPMVTRGLAVAVWQNDDLVYAIVVEGGDPIYRQLLPRRTLT